MYMRIPYRLTLDSMYCSIRTKVEYMYVDNSRWDASVDSDSATNIRIPTKWLIRSTLGNRYEKVPTLCIKARDTMKYTVRTHVSQMS